MPFYIMDCSIMEMLKDCPMMEMLKDCPMVEMFKDCPMMKMFPILMMMDDKKLKKIIKIFKMMMTMKMMCGLNKPCEGACKESCKEPCQKPCEGPCEQKPICLNKFPSNQPFACYKQGEYSMCFGKMDQPAEILKKLKEKSCPFFSDPKVKFVLVYIDDSHEVYSNILNDIVHVQDNISVIRLWTDDKGEFSVSQYKKCHKECKIEAKEEVKK